MKRNRTFPLIPQKKQAINKKIQKKIDNIKKL